MKLAQANVVHTSRVQQRQELHGARAMRCSSRHWHTAADKEVAPKSPTDFLAQRHAQEAAAQIHNCRRYTVAVAASSDTPSSHLESRVCAHFEPAVPAAAIPECGICDARLG